MARWSMTTVSDGRGDDEHGAKLTIAGMLVRVCRGGGGDKGRGVGVR